MKICTACSFENPDQFQNCLQCQNPLPLTQEEEQLEQAIKGRYLDNLWEEDEDSLVNSWRKAMIHRFDWIWEIGERIMEIKHMSAIVILLMIMALSLVGLSFMMYSLGL